MIYTYEHEGKTIAIQASNQYSADWMFALKTGGDAEAYHGCDCGPEDRDCKCEEEKQDELAQEEIPEDLFGQEEEINPEAE